MSNTIHAEASSVINAPPEEVYAVISDYQIAHPAILPKPPFIGLEVEKGGQGAGTVVFTRMKAWGKETVLHQEVTEPEPGRVLLETDLDTGQYTTFTFEPLNDGQQTRVTIASVFPVSPGFKGFLERLVQAPIVSRVYKQELDNLAAYLQSKASA